MNGGTCSGIRFSIVCGFAFFLFAVCVGYHFGSTSWNGQIIVSVNDLTNARVPAAIRKELDFSRLEGTDLITATQQRLVSAAQIILDPTKQGEMGIELGHFVTRDENGQRRLACDSFYNRLALRFVADGVAEGGESPVMDVEGPCRTSANNISNIEPIWVPVKRILGERSADMDLNYDENVKFHFDNMGEKWPMHWTLQSVRLYNTEEDGREIDINSQELREIRQQPIVLDWKSAQ